MATLTSTLASIGRKMFPFRLVIGVAFALVALEWLSPTPFFGPQHRMVHAMALLIVAGGIALRGWAAGSAGFHTRSERIEAMILATGGPFAYVRNPIYAGSMCLGVGMSLLIGDPLAFAVTAVAFAILYLGIIPAEEAFLRGQFRESYLEYCRAVPRLIPRLRRWERGARQPFYWRATLGEMWIVLVLVGIYLLLMLEEHWDRVGLS